MSPPTRPLGARRRAAALACVGVALALHVVLLSVWPGGGQQPAPAAQVVAVQVRQVSMAPARAAGAVAPGPGPVGDAPQPAATPAAVTLAPATPPLARAPAAVPATPAAVLAAAADAAAAPAETAPATRPSAPTPAPTTSDATPTAAAEAPPTYATRIAPAATLHYAVRRGEASGQARLAWQRLEGDRYLLVLDSRIGSRPALGSASTGAIDAHGLAPERYTESRRGRERRAANFEREQGRIRYSGPSVEHALPPGAQDRLSWMLQLGAVLAAEPALEAAGREVRLFVAGSRGDAEVWTFISAGREPLALADGGSAEAVRLRREPRRDHDVAVDIWLDPARHHLPLRLAWALRGPRAAEAIEWWLERIDAP